MKYSNLLLSALFLLAPACGGGKCCKPCKPAACSTSCAPACATPCAPCEAPCETSCEPVAQPEVMEKAMPTEDSNYEADQESVVPEAYAMDYEEEAPVAPAKRPASKK